MTVSSVFDKYNERYMVDVSESDTSLFVYVVWKRTTVGQILCALKSPSTLIIGNIEIFEHPLLPRNRLFPRRPLQRSHINFRQRGLGSAMLEYLIAQAERLGIVAIHGEIIPIDLLNTPYLRDFYRKHGFIVQDTPEQLPQRAAIIYRQVKA